MRRSRETHQLASFVPGGWPSPWSRQPRSLRTHALVSIESNYSLPLCTISNISRIPQQAPPSPVPAPQPLTLRSINEGPNTEETLGKFLTSTFVGRFEDMGKLQLEQAASGLAPGAVDSAVLASKMAQEEKHIYAMARRQEESLRKWMGWNQRAVAPSRKRKGFLAG